MGANKHRPGREQRNEKMPKVPAMETKDIEKVEEILEYHFKNHCLIEEALTHPSFYHPYKPDVSYERLEFIGDAVLNCLVADWVFSMYPDLAPGLLTRLRAANVDTEKLARVAVCSDLYLYLRHRASVLNEQVKQKYILIIESFSFLLMIGHLQCLLKIGFVYEEALSLWSLDEIIMTVQYNYRFVYLHPNLVTHF